MKVLLDKSFALPAPADAAWALLQDVAAVAGCMPGARITEQVACDRGIGQCGISRGHEVQDPGCE